MTASGRCSAPQVSVVIPTFNRLSELRQVLDALEHQDGVEHGTFEVVVVDDGSTDGTWRWLRRQQRQYPLICHHQANAGPARARNQGVAIARGRLVLFLGDDTVPEPGWLLCHLEEHRLHGHRAARLAEHESELLTGRHKQGDPAAGPVAVLGYTTFPRSFDSPFHRWINEMGAQFGYLLIERPTAVPFNFFYTSNISLPRQVLVSLGGFREDFPAAAWEDIELSYRACRRGLRLRYQPRARTIHLHPVSPAAFCRRQRTSGASAAIYAGLHPELAAFLGLDRAARSRRLAGLQEALLRALVRLGEHLPGMVPARCYQALLDLAYLQGLRANLQGSMPNTRDGSTGDATA